MSSTPIPPIPGSQLPAGRRSVRPSGNGAAIATSDRSDERARLLRKGPPKEGTEEHDRIVRSIVSQEEYLRRQLTPFFRDVTDYWGLYLGYKTEFRTPEEMWRANIRVPYPYSVVETTTAAVSDLFASGDPLIQATNVFDRDRDDVESIQKHLDHILQQNGWRLLQDMMNRAMAIQGACFGKIVHKRQAQEVFVHFDEKTKQDFLKRLGEAQQVSSVRAPHPIREAAKFEKYRQMINQSYPGIKLPEAPTPGMREVVLREGPEIQVPSIYELRVDPFIEGIQTQPIFIHRYVKPLSWLESMVESGAFIKDAMNAGGNPDDSRRMSQWDREVADMAGFPVAEDDPRFNNSVEVWECFRPFEKMKRPIIINRKMIVNAQPYAMPYWHGQIPYFVLRNNTAPKPHPGLLGMSEYQQTKDMFYEMDTLRSLRLDAVTLAVLPIFLKTTSSGDIPESVAKMKPGDIINVTSANLLQQLVKNDPGILHGFREMAEIKLDIDETSATTPNVRGAAATVGRVSATESERRVAQALVRQKMKVVRLEEDWSPAIHQALVLLYQFSDPQVQVDLGGGTPAIVYPREKLLSTIQANYRFRGASRVIDKAISAQQMMQFASTFGQYLLPQEMRELMKDVAKNMGIMGVDRIVSSDGNKLIRVPVPGPLEAGVQQQGAALGQQGAAIGASLQQAMAAMGGGGGGGAGFDPTQVLNTPQGAFAPQQAQLFGPDGAPIQSGQG